MSFIPWTTGVQVEDSPTWYLPANCPVVPILSAKEPLGFCASYAKAICWSKAVNIVSIKSVNIAAPSPIMWPELGNATQCPITEGSVLTEICSL